MTKYFTILLVAFCGSYSSAQNYFQQKVDFEIHATLDDQKHLLTSEITMNYAHHGGDTLREIWFHLWANAHQSNSSSAMAKQLIEKGNLDWYFGKAEQLGGYSELNFFQDGQKLEIQYDPLHADLCKVKLGHMLLPNTVTVIKMSAKLKIPFAISRIGHVGQDYSMTQWFPKPAVYDRTGWHTFPYLDQGEFFAEFGDYDVFIKLPENYVVAATGVLKTEKEASFLQQKIIETQKALVENTIPSGSAPPSASTSKTVHFRASTVHDFAWFASKEFAVMHEEAVLQNGEKVNIYAYFPLKTKALWQNATTFARRAIEYFSNEVGAYPYPQATVVNGNLLAGGGMEYPMITVIPSAASLQSLDVIIAHELTHNWFYGILASNERDYPWLDEGFTAFYEQKYRQEFYSSTTGQFPYFMYPRTGYSDQQLLYRLLAFQHLDQSGSKSSGEYSRMGYLHAAYGKPTLSLQLLEKYVGKPAFKQATQQYFSRWRFRHPQPLDCQNSFEQSLDQRLDWLFKDLLQSNKRPDYGIKGIKKTDGSVEIRLKNSGAVPHPIPLSWIRHHQVLEKKWIAGFEKDTTIQWKGVESGKVMIDAEGITPDLNRKNNSRSVSGWCSNILPVSLSFFPKVLAAGADQFFLTPVPAYNANDRFMLGAALYKNFLPAGNWEPYLIPLYSFSTRSLNGMAGTEHFWYPSRGIYRLNLGANYQTFHYSKNAAYNFLDRYHRLHYWLGATFKNQMENTSPEWYVELNSTFVRQQYGEGVDFGTKAYVRKSRQYVVNELLAQYKNNATINPTSFKVSVQQGEGFSKIFGHVNQTIRYASPKRGLNGAIELHVFAGTFLNYENPTAAVNFRMSGTTGFEYFQKDYRYETALLGRNESAGSLWSQQIFQQDASLKTLSNLGSTNKWMFGFGFKDGLPLPLPIQYYADIAIYPDFQQKVAVAYSAGLSLVLIRDQLEVFFPLFDSQNIKDNLALQGRNGFLQKVTFLLNFKALNPYKLSRDFTL